MKQIGYQVKECQIFTLKLVLRKTQNVLKTSIF